MYSVCGGHFISMNFPPRNWEGYYVSSSKMGGKLCLLIGARTLPFIHLVIDIDLVHDHFCLVIYNRRWEHSQKWWAGIGYRLVLSPLFWEGPHPRVLPNT